MSRPIKYKNADDLIDNCTILRDCLVWPEANMASPTLSTLAPLAKTFGTTSVVRVLFTIVRFPPAGRRLICHCTTRFCINPFHHTEAKKYRDERRGLSNPNGLLISQIEHREGMAPPDDYLAGLYPRKPEHLRFLAETAARAGVDCSGIAPANRRLPTLAEIKAVYADPDKPLFRIKPKSFPADTKISGSGLTPTNDEESDEPDFDSASVPLDLSPHPDDFGPKKVPQSLDELLARMTSK